MKIDEVKDKGLGDRRKEMIEEIEIINGGKVI